MLPAYEELSVENSKPPVALGSIVVLKSHPFFASNHAQMVHLAGHAAHVPPMMVVIEVVIEKTESTDPERGVYHEHNRSYQCLCVWYSAKNCAFEQNWFSYKVLRKVADREEIERLSSVRDEWEIGDTVTLITSSCEADKIQVSKKWKDGEIMERGELRSALAHVCPPLTIIGSCANKASEPLIDSKTGKTKRWRASRFIKVKYYNEKEDRFSEHLLPESGLTQLKAVSQNLIEKLLEIIRADLFICIKDAQDKDIISIGVPKAVNYVSGKYFLLVKCYLYNTMVPINISQYMKLYSLPQFSQEEMGCARRGYLSVLPNFISGGDSVKIIHSNDADAIQKLFEDFPDSPWRITYKAHDEKTSQRTILPIEVLSSDERLSVRRNGDNLLEQGSREREVKMIYASCFNSAKAKLFFSSARIMQLQVLPITISRETFIASRESTDWNCIWPNDPLV